MIIQENIQYAIVELLPKKKGEYGDNGDKEKQVTSPSNSKKTVHDKNNGNAKHANPNLGNSNHATKVLQSGKEVGNVNDIYKWKTNNGKKHGIAHSNGQKHLALHATQGKGNNEVRKKDGEEGEISDGNAVDKEQSFDSITSSHEIHAMFDKVADEKDAIGQEVDKVLDINPSTNVHKLQHKIPTKGVNVKPVVENKSSVKKQKSGGKKKATSQQQRNKCNTVIKDNLQM
ncbi:hypothetical protein K7X08_000063 [Anisodus acutangulus]|uniref:Uncharacterized protein n=1 Tax=Anisodus acutangulus TaxID=402998 RepID=A0A9Q1M689_9SOLA|nr:hypothetical protein K7X08_000063 [Anisodus acutangulus]